ncbi:diacylglycerol/lipid kinase family protein [Terrimonas pollutisoli]|uniref:diacylglycerol/lipid kinase family protein n=1 Tax=Terrimonas pollutisoli TaxID=3034147 RepID=UPI0023EC41A6|nr:YegS/Rv2252/BmrU family lipid kinase [Terrimonas sp. H1YJ31]
MQQRIIYIINPISGTRTKKDLQQFVEQKTKEKGIPYHIFPSVASGDYSFLQPIIKEEKITDIVIAGGDGTVSQVVSSLMGEDVNFGIIPCGSGNGLALAAKISKQPAKALDVIFSGKASAIDGFYVNKQFACMLCGVGFDAKVAHEFAHQPKRGLKTYATLVSKNFFSISPYEFSIESNGMEFSTEAFFISIANSNQFGNNFTIAPKALLADGLLDIVIVKKSAKPILLYNLVKQIFAGKIKKVESSLHQPIIYFQTKAIVIKNKSNAPMHIDGDPAETPEKLKIEIRKKCFRLIQPAN